MDRLLADLVVGVHFLFVLFVLLGGLLVLRWPRLAYVHLPAAAWGVLIELTGWVCPLTPLEQSLRLSAGEQGYSGSFIEHWVGRILFHDWSEQTFTFIYAGFFILVGLTFWVVRPQRRRSRQRV